MTPTTEGAVVVRGRHMPFGTLLWLAAASTLTVLAVPPKEIIPRWRRTVPYAILWLLAAVGAWGVWHPPLVLTVMIGAFIAAGSLVVVSAFLIRFRSHEVWRVQVGRDVALIQLTEQRTGAPLGERRHKRWVLHSWAAWRRGRGLGRLVADEALDEAPRPLWIQAGTPELRQKYLELGAVDAESGAWMTFPADG